MIFLILYLTTKKLSNSGALPLINKVSQNKKLRESYAFLRNIIS